MSENKEFVQGAINLTLPVNISVIVKDMAMDLNENIV